MIAEQIIEADRTWLGDAFHSGVQIVVNTAGRIDAVGRLNRTATKRLEGRAILPGLINAHSHAFQRGLRGFGETFPKGAGTFWTWREAMYALVESMDADKLYRLSLQAFREMLAAGITTVGEFHYLHHDHTREGYALDDAVLAAAHEAGIRMALLYAYYNTGGVGKPLLGGQRQFRTATPAEYWQRIDTVAKNLRGDRQTLGAVVHSIRAADVDDLVAIHRESARRGLVFHMHVEEQRLEIDDCVAAYGVTPMALVNDCLAVDERFTAIHCTHTAPQDLERYMAAGGNVCLCPSTEGNLGDGFPNVAAMLAHKGKVCIGSDANVRLSVTEDLRWLEYAQRLKSETRGVMVNAAGDVAPALLEMATVNGARSLALPVGRIAAGEWADMITIDLAASPLIGWTPESLLTTWIFGTGDNVIQDVCVGGKWVIIG